MLKEFGILFLTMKRRLRICNLCVFERCTVDFIHELTRFSWVDIVQITPKNSFELLSCQLPTSQICIRHKSKRAHLVSAYLLVCLRQKKILLLTTIHFSLAYFHWKIIAIQSECKLSLFFFCAKSWVEHKYFRGIHSIQRIWYHTCLPSFLREKYCNKKQKVWINSHFRKVSDRSITAHTTESIVF